MRKRQKYIVDSKDIIRSATRKMDKGGIGFILIKDQDEPIIGIVSNEDFRSAILNETSLEKKSQK